MPLKDYVPFSIADSYFYDVPDALRDTDSLLEPTTWPIPDGWQRQDAGLAISIRPSELRSPDQGWKVHISATPDTAGEMIAAVWPYCMAKNVPFKFLRSKAAVLAVNSKYWDRTSSGKFITIYPPDLDQFETILSDLDVKLRNFTGPYILSDVRFRKGPLFARYGAFRLMWLEDEAGSRTPAIRTPAGALVPDRREPIFSVPEFAPIPRILEPFLKQLRDSFSDFPYEFEQALHFSNGGGIYLGRNVADGGQVLLREARPHAGLDSNGRDAVFRLRNECSVLTRLQGLPCVPRLVDQLPLWEHQFLITEFIQGTTLLEEIVRRYPLVHPEPTESEIRQYVAWASEIFTRIEVALEAIHRRGVKIADLHPENIMIRLNGDVVFVDFECSGGLEEMSTSGLGAPGFIATTPLSAKAADLFAFDRVRLMVLLPLVPILSLDPSKTTALLNIASESLGLDSTFRHRLLKKMDRNPLTDKGDLATELFTAENLDWPTIRGSFAAGIIASASPGRKDRLFPGDPTQFRHGGATLAYGAAGVLLALAWSGENVHPDLVTWLSAASGRKELCSGGGFYNGPHGVAFALESLGAADKAVEIFEMARARVMPISIGLFDGRAGIALNLLHFARITQNERLISEAIRIGNELGAIVSNGDSYGSTFRSGLFYGGTGCALLFLKLYDQTSDERYLDLAEAALRKDLSFGSTLPDGTFHLRSGSRYLVYLDGGSAGIAVVLSRYLSLREVPDLRAQFEAIRLGCCCRFVMQPGLFQGRAGLIAVAADSIDSESHYSAVLAQIRRLGWHTIAHHGHLVTPGTGLTKLSLDLATGSAGVLLALRAFFHREKLRLPFL